MTNQTTPFQRQSRSERNMTSWYSRHLRNPIRSHPWADSRVLSSPSGRLPASYWIPRRERGSTRDYSRTSAACRRSVRDQRLPSAPGGKPRCSAWATTRPGTRPPACAQICWGSCSSVVANGETSWSERPPPAGGTAAGCACAQWSWPADSASWRSAPWRPAWQCLPSPRHFRRWTDWKVPGFARALLADRSARLLQSFVASTADEVDSPTSSRLENWAGCAECAHTGRYLACVSLKLRCKIRILRQFNSCMKVSE